jgi:hypothetical protein
MITYWIEQEEDEDDPPRYSNIIVEEEYEEDLDGFEGLEKGSTIDEPPCQDTIKPWDPSENFFIIV